MFSPLMVLHKGHFLRKTECVNPFYTSLIVQWLRKSPLLYDLSAFIWSFPQWVQIYAITPKLSGIVLQIGCGTGLFNLYCNKRGEKLCLYNMDMNSKYLKRAKKLKRLDHSVCGDAHDLPFSDKSFDTILLTRCFHHIRRPKRVFQACLRILKPKGSIIIMDPVALNLGEQQRSFMINSYLDGLIWRYSPKAFINHIQSNLPNGFELESYEFIRQINLSNYNDHYPHMDGIVILRKKK